MPTSALQKNSSNNNIYPIAGGISKFMPSSKCINSKVNVVARLEFELANFEAVVQHFNNYTMEAL